jgi:hypothetical protein
MPATVEANRDVASLLHGLGAVVEPATPTRIDEPSAGASILSAVARASEEDLDLMADVPDLLLASGQKTVVAGAGGFAATTHLKYPVLSPGADNPPWWVERLQVALLARGHYPGDREMQVGTAGPSCFALQGVAGAALPRVQACRCFCSRRSPQFDGCETWRGD